MTMRPAHHNGRTDARPDRPHGTSAKAPGRKIVAIVALLGAIACVPAFATNTLQDVSSSAPPDGQVQLTLKFAQPGRSSARIQHGYPAPHRSRFRRYP